MFAKHVPIARSVGTPLRRTIAPAFRTSMPAGSAASVLINCSRTHWLQTRKIGWPNYMSRIGLRKTSLREGTGLRKMAKGEQDRRVEGQEQGLFLVVGWLRQLGMQSRYAWLVMGLFSLLPNAPGILNSRSVCLSLISFWCYPLCNLLCLLRDAYACIVVIRSMLLEPWRPNFSLLSLAVSSHYVVVEL